MDDLAYDPDPGRPPRGSRVEMENLDVHPGSCEKRSCGWPDPYSLTALAQLSGYSRVTAGILQETNTLFTDAEIWLMFMLMLKCYESKTLFHG